MRIMRVNASGVRTFSSVARMAARDRAFPASVPPIPPVIAVFQILLRDDRLRDLLGESVSRSGHAARDGLPEDQQVGLEMLGARIAAGTRTDGVRLIEDQQRAETQGSEPPF